MRRLPAFIFLAAALALVSASCGDSDEAPATTAAPPTTAPPVATTVAPTTTAAATTTTAPTTTMAPTTTAAPTTIAAPTTTSGGQFAAAEATLATVLEACNTYLVGLGDDPMFDGSETDPTVGGEFTEEVAPGIFEFVDAAGIVLLVDTNEGVATGADGPDGPAPRPYLFWCPPEVFPGTLDEGAPPDDVVLLGDGLGIVDFGAEPEETLAALTGALGEPDEDSGWIDSFSSFGTCPGSEVRVVRWDELEVYFTDTEAALGAYPDPGSPHFFSWLAATFVDDEPPAYGFSTPEGVAPGSPLSFVRDVYGENQVEVAYEDAFDIYFLNIADAGLGGSVSGETGNDLVESLQGGIGCGE